MTVHEQVLQSMRQMAGEFAAAGVTLELPPPSGTMLSTLYVDLIPGTMLAAQFAFDHRFANPLGYFQGGFISAAFDEVYGPLTYMAAQRPVITIEMSTTYLRPFTAKDETMVIRAEVVSKTRSLMVLRAEARNKDGKLLATSTTHSLIATDQKLRS